jgi:Phage-related lysozyme (muraminidase)
MKEKIRRNAAILSVSALALVGIAAHEGFREKAYRDVTGVPTVGYGGDQGSYNGLNHDPFRGFHEA